MKRLGLLLMICTFGAFAQKTITGQIVDHEKKGLPFATVMLLKASDSSMVAFTRTDTSGIFKIKSKSPQAHIIKASFVGYIPAERRVEADMTDMGVLPMNLITNELMEVVIKTTKKPLTIRGDTIVYNPAVFNLGKNATVEDLLKKLPGIEVKSDGTIKAQGETVRKVTVDGKTFFGDDPKLATKNLPADAINEVQVFNDKSEETKFTGIDDGKKEKTINLDLKEDFKKGSFGKIMAGGGLNERFATKANYNRFNAKSQFSYIGQGNNINELGYDFGEYQSFKGSNSFDFGGGNDFGFENNSFELGSGFLFGGNAQNGFNKNFTSGVNYNYNHKKAEYSHDLFWSNVHSKLASEALQNNFLGEEILANNSSSLANNFNGAFSSHAKLKIKLDSLSQLVFRFNLETKNNENTNQTSQNLLTASQNNNSNQLDNTENSAGLNSLAELVYRHKFMKKGRAASISTSWDANTKDGSGLQNANTLLNIDNASTFVQKIAHNSEQSSLKANLGFIEPLTKKFNLQVFANAGLVTRQSDRKVTDIDEAKKETINEFYSRNYEGSSVFQRAGFQLRYAFNGVNFAVGLAGQNQRLSGTIQNPNSLNVTSFQRNFKNLLPHARLNLEPVPNSWFSIDLNANLREPTIEQLLPNIQNANPFYKIKGNPELRPEVGNNFSMNFGMYNPEKNSNFWIGGNYTYYQFQIVDNIDVVDTWFTTATPMNISGGYNFGGNANLNLPIYKSKLTWGISGSYNNGTTRQWVNSVENATQNGFLQGNTNLNFNPNDHFTMYLGFEPQLSTTRFSINTDQNQRFVNQVIDANMTIFMKNDFSNGYSFKNTNYVNDKYKIDRNVPICNIWLSKLMLKDKKGEVRLSVNDLLNRNVGFNMMAGQNYFRNNLTQTLGRYYLLSFTYSLKSLGKPKGRQDSIIIIN